MVEYMIFLYNLFGDSLVVNNDSYIDTKSLRGISVSFNVYVASEDIYSYVTVVRYIIIFIFF